MTNLNQFAAFSSLFAPRTMAAAKRFAAALPAPCTIRRDEICPELLEVFPKGQGDMARAARIGAGIRQEQGIGEIQRRQG